MSLRRYWKIGICLIAIFCAGGVTGAMLMYRAAKQYIAKQANLERWTVTALRDYEKKLALTPEQTEKLRPVFEDTAKDLREIRASTATNALQVLRRMNEEVARELNPEQRQKLEEVNREFARRLRAQQAMGMPKAK